MKKILLFFFTTFYLSGFSQDCIGGFDFEAGYGPWTGNGTDLTAQAGNTGNGVAFNAVNDNLVTTLSEREAATICFSIAKSADANNMKIEFQYSLYANGPWTTMKEYTENDLTTTHQFQTIDNFPFNNEVANFYFRFFVSERTAGSFYLDDVLFFNTLSQVCNIEINSVTPVCNGNNAEFEVNFSVSGAYGPIYEVDIDRNGYQQIDSGDTYIMNGPTTAKIGAVVTLRDPADVFNECLTTTTVDIPECSYSGPPIRINEIHYDNDGTDSGEFVEIFAAVPNGLANPADYTIYLVNGNNNASYNSITLDATTFTTDIYGSYYVWNLPSNGIQNGAPDGVALCGPSGIIQFWSYEGTITGSGGCIDTVASTGMGASESGDTPVGFSLQFFPTTADPVLRTNGIDGEWAAGVNTKGAVNNQAILPIELASISAEWLGVEKVSQIEWTTLSETNNDFFEVQHSVNGIDWVFVGKVMGNGTTDVAHDYNFTHSKAVNGVNYYRVKQVDFNGSFSFSEIVTVDAEGVDGLQIVSANRQAISITTSHAGAASYQVLNSMGRVIATAEFEAAKGNQAIYFNQELAHGFYIIQITINGERKTAKFVIH